MSHSAQPKLGALPRIVAAIAWMVVIFGVSARRAVPQPPGLGPELTATLGHFTVYLVLAILLWWALEGFVAGSRRWLLALALAVLYGVGDEWHQSFVPGRTPDVLDVLVDALGAASGLALAEWFGARRESRPRPRQLTDGRGGGRRV